MMSTRDFEFKQIAFVFTDEGEKISFKNDNLIITDAEGKVKHQSTCYRLFILFVCGDYCLTTGLLDRSKKFSIVFMTPNLRVTAMFSSKAEGNVLLRKKQYEYDKTDIAAHVIANKIHNQCALLKRKRKKSEEEKKVIKKLEQFEKDVLMPDLNVQEIMGVEGISAKLYDISNDKVRTKFAKYLSKFGFRLQYSVFEITNSDTVLKNIESEIKNSYMKTFTEEDSIIIFNL